MESTNRENEIKLGLQSVKEDIKDFENVELVAVSKTYPLEDLEIAYNLGQRSFGENKAQEILEKQDILKHGDVRMHFIGHLQTNKVRQIIDKVVMIHSVDSIKLAKEIDKQANKINKIMDVLIEVNIGAEESKYGIKPSEALEFAKELTQFKNIRLRGLMCVAPFTDIPENNTKFFEKMKELLLDISAAMLDNSNMIDTLSMGMSGDYKVALECGATIIRVGTSIFGKRNYN